MKNKTLQRVLSFTLALILCFSVAVKPIEAKALAVESWLIYAIITYMAAVGITFTAMGGVDAMAKAVQEKVEEYKVTGIDLMGLISQSIRFNGGGDGKGPSFWFTMTALAAIGEFMNWLRGDEVWGAGEEVSISDSGYYVPIEYGTITVDNVIQPIKLLADSNGQPYKRTTGSGWTSVSNECGTLVPYPNGFSFNYGGATVAQYATKFYYTDINGVPSVKLETNNGNISISIDILLSHLNCTIDEFAGVTFFLNEGTSYTKTQNRVGLAFVKTNGWIYLTNTWVVLETSTGSVSSFYEYKEQGFTITIPESTTEFDVEESQLVEISFDAFQGHSGSFASPEEFAEALEQKITEVGTIPSISTEVITDPDAEPEVEPSPVIPPPDTPVTDYPDVGDMGLPSLGEALKSKFPFSLPWTLGTIIGIFATTRQTPKWTVELPEPLNTAFTIDLGEYEEIGYILRWTSDIGFAIALLLATRKFIHW